MSPIDGTSTNDETPPSLKSLHKRLHLFSTGDSRCLCRKHIRVLFCGIPTHSILSPCTKTIHFGHTFELGQRHNFQTPCIYRQNWGGKRRSSLLLSSLGYHCSYAHSYHQSNKCTGKQWFLSPSHYSLEDSLRISGGTALFKLWWLRLYQLVPYARKKVIFILTQNKWNFCFQKANKMDLNILHIQEEVARHREKKL